MTATATEETASTEAIPLGSYQALVAWREHREAVLFAPGSSPATSEALPSIVRGLFFEVEDEIAAAFEELAAGTDRALVASNSNAHARFDAFQHVVWDAPPLPKRIAGASLPAAVRVPPDALANFTPMPGSEKAVENAIARHEALAAAPVAEVLPAPAEDPDAAAQERADESLAAWTGSHKTLADEKADEAVEAFTTIHDTDPAGTAVIDLDAEGDR